LQEEEDNLDFQKRAESIALERNLEKMSELAKSKSLKSEITKTSTIKKNQIETTIEQEPNTPPKAPMEKKT